MSIQSSCGICRWRRVGYGDGGRGLGGKDDGRVERDEDEQVDGDGGFFEVGDESVGFEAGAEDVVLEEGEGVIGRKREDDLW